MPGSVRTIDDSLIHTVPRLRPEHLLGIGHRVPVIVQNCQTELRTMRRTPVLEGRRHDALLHSAKKIVSAYTSSDSDDDDQYFAAAATVATARSPPRSTLSLASAASAEFLTPRAEERSTDGGLLAVSPDKIRETALDMFASSFGAEWSGTNSLELLDHETLHRDLASIKSTHRRLHESGGITSRESRSLWARLESFATQAVSSMGTLEGRYRTLHQHAADAKQASTAALSEKHAAVKALRQADERAAVKHEAVVSQLFSELAVAKEDAAAHLGNLEDLEQEGREFDRAFAALKKERDGLTEDAKRLTTQLSAAERDVGQMELSSQQALDHLEAKVGQMQEQMAAARQAADHEVAGLQQTIADQQGELAGLEGLGGEQTAAIEAMETQLEAAGEAARRLQSELEEAHSECSEQKVLQQRVAGLEASSGQLQAATECLESQLEAAEERKLGMVSSLETVRTEAASKAREHKAALAALEGELEDSRRSELELRAEITAGSSEKAEQERGMAGMRNSLQVCQSSVQSLEPG